MFMSKQLPLSARQREIMEVIWDRGEVSVFEVREALAERRAVARNTVRTMMERMEKKGWLTHRVIGRTFCYSALVPREVNLGSRILEIIERSCGGKPERLMAALLNHRGLSNDEVDRIRAMLDQAKTVKRKSRGRGRS
jgi:BlaI family penicillinase repressor